jgi:hypothetical protein
VIKETTMFNTKNILAAVSLAVVSAAGIGGASAQPYWDRHDTRALHRYERFDDRFAPRVNHWRIAEALRFRGLHMISQPHFVRGRMVVRAEDRFGRPLIVHVNPYSGKIVRVMPL